MLVYRLENEAGKGPYWWAWDDDNLWGCLGDKSLLREAFAKHKAPDRPAPSQAFGDVVMDIIVANKFVFGCPSVENLVWWFSSERETLVRNNFLIGVYESQEVILAGKQLAFRKEKLVGRIAW